MKNASILLFVLLFGAIFIGCNKDKDENPEPSGPATTASITLSGVVMDESEAPISGATVTVAGTEYTTDAYGTYYIKNVKVPIDRYVVEFEKNGYFEVIRSEEPIAGQSTIMDVVLINDLSTYAVTDFWPSSQEDSLVSQYFTIVFPANNYIDANGAPYTGTVNAKAAYLDPTTGNYSASVPGGDNAGVDDTDADVLLDAIAGIIVFLTDDAGNSLNLDTNNVKRQTASLYLNIPASLQGSAPDVIDIYTFDEVKGLAYKAGTVTKQQNKYFAAVDHFSYWTFANGHTQRGTITGTVKDDQGRAIPGVRVVVGKTIAYTDANGNYSKVVPADVNFDIGIATQYYGNVISQVASVPSGSSQTVNITVPSLMIVTGKLVNCSAVGTAGQIVFNFYSSYSVSKTVITKDGNFSIAIPSTVTSVTIVANGNNTDKETWVYPTYLASTYDAGNIVLCPPPTLGENSVTIDGKKTTLTSVMNATGSVDDASSYGFCYLGATSQQAQAEFSLEFDGINVGSYTVGDQGGYVYVSTVDGGKYCTGTVTISRMDAVGGLIEGTFTGTGAADGSASHNVSIKFSVERTALGYK